jgi:phosphoglycerate dehydrogenase-like enzyme
MDVLAYSPRLTPARAARIGAASAPLAELMARSHFVAICAPLTEETRGMIGAREIAAMRRDAVLVNVGRGPIVDQRALAEALADGRIFGAGLDVFESQPVAADDPLAGLDSAVLSPHAICDTYELRRDVLREIAGQLTMFLRGGQPEGVLNPSVWDDGRFRAIRARLLSEIGA